MKKEIKFSLVYRDMWQSSGKYQPRVDQLVQIAPLIIEMGCFSRVETNGGAFEQVNLLYGENPNKAVRAFTKPFNDAGIQTHMLDRGLNALRMYPVPADVRKLMYKVKHAQGVDITRIFCGLNDVRNIIPSIQYAKAAGMIPQATLCITFSPVHTVEYYANIADQLIEAGAPEICLKDMAGVGRPVFLGKLTKAIKDKHPEVIIQYHGHSGPGLSMASILEVCQNGADVIDVAIEPISWGKVHPDVISVQAMLKDAGFKVPEINMSAYMKARAKTQEFIDDFLGYFMNPGNKLMSSLLLTSGLPGGMMGSMMADLEGVHSGINLMLKNQGKPELSIDDLLVKLFEEVQYVWPMVGYPPLVTPFSQYVKNIALMNILTEVRGEPKFSMMDKHIWGMILGESGKLPGKLDPQIIALAKEKGYEFTDKNPQDNYPDELDKYRKEMDENGWEYGEDDEELFELAMHDRQYRDYKSGVAKERFLTDLAKAKEESMAEKGYTAEDILAIKRAKYEPVTSEVKGQVIWEIDVDSPSMAPAVGKHFSPDDIFCYITTSWGEHTPVKANFDGKIIEVIAKQGDKINKGEPLAYIERTKE
ncbi:Pyruvate carboxylase [Bacteroides coprosuis DSM 18011]|uniref:Pyruvate carboxylase n=1 Tax=Bacteroides coprosuis DSM 18011 TaxID=679937 RepID=F3ZUB5_9BACE|nr:MULTISPECIES: oxaloacetate decarboxylase [Bacteroides]EGJ71360.1 Pyruvate carboxylase [Bacteroides coprosuis DSM 18011]HJD91379.1 oxaloacetate decarboxylase [Bacteroides coprosuis]